MTKTKTKTPDFFVYYQYDEYGQSRSTAILTLSSYVCQKGELVLAEGEWLFSVKNGGTAESTPYELVRKTLKKSEVRVGVETAEALGIDGLQGLTLHPEYVYQRALSGATAFGAEGDAL